VELIFGFKRFFSWLCFKSDIAAVGNHEGKEPADVAETQLRREDDTGSAKKLNERVRLPMGHPRFHNVP
jgi:hypothetical protein